MWRAARGSASVRYLRTRVRIERRGGAIESSQGDATRGTDRVVTIRSWMKTVAGVLVQVERRACMTSGSFVASRGNECRITRYACKVVVLGFLVVVLCCLGVSVCCFCFVCFL